MTVNNLIGLWKTFHCQNLAKSTVYSYYKYLDTYLTSDFKSRDIGLILQTDIQAIINDMHRSGKRSKTQKNMVGIMHSMFQFAVCNGYCSYNPVLQIVISKTAEYEYCIYTEQQFETLLKFLEEKREIIPVALAGICGMRLSEILGLRWSDVDFKNSSIKIHQAAVAVGSEVDLKPTPKSAAGNRNIEVPQKIMTILAKYRPDFDCFVYGKKQNPLLPEHGKTFYTRFRSKCRQAGLPYTRFHDLRHYAATQFLDMGVADKYAAAYLGHSDTNMTKKYQHIRRQVIPFPCVNL